MQSKPMNSLLAQLKQFSSVVADSGDIEAIKQFQPDDATTNPSLVLKAIKSGQFDALFSDCIERYDDEQQVLEHLIVGMGYQIADSISGYISTEVNPDYSFDSDKTIEQAKRLIDYYQQLGLERHRVLIKIASTWQGIQAAKHLETLGIQCNLTLLFCIEQAMAAADAKVTLISPFVGRITDWYAKHQQRTINNGIDDPGVESVKQIFQTFKSMNIPTIVMAASFRNTGQILQLAGCDKLTISPSLLAELEQQQSAITHYLSPSKQQSRAKNLSQAQFEAAIEANDMAKEKLAEGIAGFSRDQATLLALIKKRLQEKTDC